MRFHWRGSKTPISGYASWRERIARKDDQPNRSAPTLAHAWAGPAELFAALGDIRDFEDLVIESVDVEAQTSFDSYPGGKRNHDLVVTGEAAGARVAVCIEAKAGETFGATLTKQASAAAKAVAANEDSNAEKRLTDLLASWAPDVGPDDRLRDQLRYQLFTAIAGTVAEAAARDAEHAVFMVHEFVTDQPELAENDAALSTFIDTVFPGTTLPGDEDLPWCIPITPPAAAECPPDLKLYLAKAVTNLGPRAPE